MELERNQNHILMKVFFGSEMSLPVITYYNFGPFIPDDKRQKLLDPVISVVVVRAIDIGIKLKNRTIALISHLPISK